MLKENGYQKSIISKIFKRITNNHSLSQSQQQWKATDIQGKETRMSINLQVKNFSVYSNLTELYTLSTLKAICINSFVNLKIEWLQKIKKILYTKLTVVLRSSLHGEFKRSLKSRSDEPKRSVRNCDCKKNENAKHCWEADQNISWNQKKFVDRESRLISRKIKETIHSLQNLNHINKIFNMLPEI